MSKITICIPVYEQKGFGYQFLKRSLDIIAKQSFTDFDVVVSDNSTYFARQKMEALCKQYPFVKYYWNKRLGMSENTNNAIQKATGELIKILFQDDYFSSEFALEDIVMHFTDDVNWLITGTDNNPNPYWTDDIETGNNKLGSPSALTIRNDNPLLFDEPMEWLLDCDYYKRLYQRYGLPKILPVKNVILGIGEHQMTNLLSDQEKQQELNYLKNKYAKN